MKLKTKAFWLILLVCPLLTLRLREQPPAKPRADDMQTAYDAALDAYRHGVGSYTDVATEQTALSRAQSEKEDAHSNVFTAAAALAFATGAILSQ